MINIDNAAARFASILAAMVRAVESSPSGVTLARMVESLQGEGIEVTEDDVRAVGVLSTGVLESRQRAGFVLAGKEKASQAVNKGVRKEAQQATTLQALIACGAIKREDLPSDLAGVLAAFESAKARKAG
jgi:hypothetical protein